MTEQTEIVTTDQTTPQTPMALISMAVQGNADPDKLGKLMELQERWEANQAKIAFDRAVEDFQAECPQIKKDRKGVHNVPFASYDDIMAVIQPLLKKHGLSVSFDSRLEDGLLHMSCHVSGHGHKETSQGTLPMPKEMKVNDTQKMGAAFSYGRRYILCNHLNIITTGEDRDASGLDVVSITDNQAMGLSELLEQLPPQRQSDFKKWAGVSDVGDIPAAKYQQVLTSLKKVVADEVG